MMGGREAVMNTWHFLTFNLYYFVRLEAAYKTLAYTVHIIRR
jgi:hypothetical protein